MIKKSLLLKNTNLLKENNPKNYSLCCRARFEPIPDFPMSPCLKRKGYDYVAREKEITVVLELQNITLTDFPSREDCVITIIRSDESKTNFIVSIPEIPSGEKREVKAYFPRGAVEGNIAICFRQGEDNSNPFFDSRIFFTKTQEILCGFKYGVQFPPSEPEKIGKWREYFYILSLKEEIEERQKQISFVFSIFSFFISLFALLISWLRFNILNVS